MKILWPEAHRNITLYFPHEQWFGTYWLSVQKDFIEHNLPQNENGLDLVIKICKHRI